MEASVDAGADSKAEGALDISIEEVGVWEAPRLLEASVDVGVEVGS